MALTTVSSLWNMAAVRTTQKYLSTFASVCVLYSYNFQKVKSGSCFTSRKSQFLLIFGDYITQFTPQFSFRSVYSCLLSQSIDFENGFSVRFAHRKWIANYIHFVFRVMSQADRLDGKYSIFSFVKLLVSELFCLRKSFQLHSNRCCLSLSLSDNI